MMTECLCHQGLDLGVGELFMGVFCKYYFLLVNEMNRINVYTYM